MRRIESVNLARFEARALEMWAEIPDALKEGVDALTVEAGAVDHEALPEVYTLGECVTDSFAAAYGGVGDMQSQVVLYHGSFRTLAARDPAFDWEGELWETLLHELLHHREAAAGEEGLDEYDRAVEQNERRHANRSFDPDYYRAIPRGPDGTVRLESEIFVETTVPPSETEARFQWRGRPYGVHVPPGDSPTFVEVTNLARGRLCLVVRRSRPFWSRLRGTPAGTPSRLARRALPLAPA